MSETLDPMVNRVIKAAGGTRALAEALGIKAPSIYGWTQIPAARVPRIAALTGIPERELRPDMYPEVALPAVESVP